MTLVLDPNDVRKALETAMQTLLISCGSDGPRSVEQEIKVAETILDGAFRLLSCARRRHNTLQRINQLPVDVGHEILKRTLDGYWGHKRYYRSLMQLRLTCTQWEQSIDSNPSFWTSISNWVPTSTWNWILDKNPSLPLCLSYTSPYPKMYEKEKYRFPETTNFLDLALKESRRIQSLRFMPAMETTEESGDADAEGEYLGRVLLSPMPLLEELLIDRGIDATRIAPLLPGPTPRLKVVSLNRAPRSLWTSSAIQGLQALDIDGGTHLNMEYLVTKILPLSPNLIHLAVRGEEAPESVLPAVGASQVALTSLKTLYLQYLSPASLAYVLGSIHIPSVEWVVAIGLPFMSLHVATYHHFARHLESAAVPGHPLPIQIWKDSITIGSKHFLLRVDNDPTVSLHISHTLLGISPEVFKSIAISLSIENDVSAAQVGEHLTAAHCAFRHITKLTIPSEHTFDWVSEPNSRCFANLTKIVLYEQHPSPALLRQVLDAAKMRNVEGTMLESVHVPRNTSIWTPGFRDICREYEQIVTIKCDAPKFLPERTGLRDYFEISSKGAPLCPPVQDVGWVETRWTSDVDES